MISLEEALKKCEEIELNVAFISDVQESSFYFDGVSYYPIYISSHNSLVRIVRRYESLKYNDKRITEKCVSVINEVQPDIIHIHGTENNFCSIVGYANCKEIPVVFSIQGLLSSCLEFYYRGLSKTAINKQETIYEKIRGVGTCNEYRHFRQRAKREGLVLSQSKYVIGRTNYDEMGTLVFNPLRQYFTVNEILRPQFFTKTWKGSFFSSEGGKIRILSILSSKPYKGIEMPIEAAKILKDRMHVDFVWEVIGLDSACKLVRAAEEKSGIKSNSVGVRYFGMMDAEEIANRMECSDIFVQTSHIENSPNTLCEAMCVGMPIVASFAGGTSSLIDDKKEGLLYQDGDPYVMAGEIFMLLNNRNLAIHLGAAAKLRAIARHSEKKITTELLSCYNSILNENK